MNVTEAIYEPSGVLRMTIDGRRAIAGTKGTILGMGACMLLGIGGDRHWDETETAELPARPPYYADKIDLIGATTDPVVVVLARRAWDAADRGPWTPGPVPIPTREEALAELPRWHPIGWFFGQRGS